MVPGYLVFMFPEKFRTRWRTEMQTNRNTDGVIILWPLLCTADIILLFTNKPEKTEKGDELVSCSFTSKINTFSSFKIPTHTPLTTLTVKIKHNTLKQELPVFKQPRAFHLHLFINRLMNIAQDQDKVETIPVSTHLWCAVPAGMRRGGRALAFPLQGPEEKQKGNICSFSPEAKGTDQPDVSILPVSEVSSVWNELLCSFSTHLP